MSRPRTFGELKASGYRARSVKDELRENVIAHLRRGGPLFPGVVGYEHTVEPQIVNALLSRHDFILLGLRGQAKTRILRSLSRFLDEWVPVVDGCPLHSDPLHPLTHHARQALETHGDATPIHWMHRDERYQEKLATPDVTIADLIGDIDPIKAATLRLDYSDERVIHYGIIPRCNRGIFAINELPDLQPRIQVGLLNILEEKDCQIRGFPVRIPLDVAMVFSANPEDYTNRGNIITPLRDRINSQIVTHYPLTREEGVAITEQEAWIGRDAGVQVVVPAFMRDLVEEVAIQARRSEYVDQNSGVSARLPIALMENLVSNAERRGLATGESRVVTRVCDLQHAVSAVSGKVELVLEGEQEGALNVARALLGRGVKAIFQQRFPDAFKPRRPRGRASAPPDEAEAQAASEYRPILEWFSSGHTTRVGDDVPGKEFALTLSAVKGLAALAAKYLEPRDPDEHAVAMELVLEGMHQSSMLSRERSDQSVTEYRDMLKSMLGGMERTDVTAEDAEAHVDHRAIVLDGYARASHAYRGDEFPLEGSRYAHWVKRFAARLPERARLLDLGCGNGLPVARELARSFDVTGVDLSPVQIERARALVPGARFMCADMAAVEFAPASFEGVAAFYSIVNLPVDEHPGLLRRIAGWLAPGGHLIATVGRDAWHGIEQDWRGVPGARMVYSQADVATYRRWFAEAGLELIEEGREPRHGNPGYAVLLARRAG